MSNNSLLDIGSQIIKSINMKRTDNNNYIETPDNLNLHDPNIHTPKDIDLINKALFKMSAMFKPEYCTIKKENINEIHELISHELNPLIFDGKKNSKVILDILLGRDSFLNNIKDPKFKAYHDMRVALSKLKLKIKKEDPEFLNYQYIIPNLELIISEIDSYLLNYLVAILIMSNSDEILHFSRKRKK